MCGFLHSAWYIVDGHRHYHGPQSNLHQLKEREEEEEKAAELGISSEDHKEPV